VPIIKKADDQDSTTEHEIQNAVFSVPINKKAGVKD
jgi:hypothetical protein